MLVERKESVINSFEAEVETLNSRIAALTSEIAHRNSSSEPGQDPAVTIATLEDEKRRLAAEHSVLEEQVASLKASVSVSTSQTKSLQNEMAKTKERLAVFEVSLQQSGGVEPPEDILNILQQNWEKLGTTINDRTKIRHQIENCLEETCRLKLDESEEQIAHVQSQITELERKIRVMCESLDSDPPGKEVSESEALGKRLESLKLQQKQLEPKFNSSVARRNSLAEHVKSLTAAMGMTCLSSLDKDLQSLLEEGVEDEELLKKRCKLDDEFLNRCEAQVSSLRLEKSKVLANNSVLQKRALVLVTEMNLTPEEIPSLVIHSIKQRCSSIPSWWKDETARVVARAVAMEGGVVRSTIPFARHLQACLESLESLSKGRRLFSFKLRQLVTRAQKTLLEIVDGEVDATEAYSSFHDALFRLPELSKEHIQACISEMDALIAGVEAMTQSEIEALTVVWEALNVSSELRGKFWGDMEESLLSMESKPEGPFHDVVHTSSIDSEEWVLVAVKDGTKTFRQLESRLFKLEKIHEEVEKLSTRQDAKSRIISLDSEIRLLSAKLSEFEDEKCDKQRLVSKKTTSSNLLKEERFRKHMQSKFSSKLEQLAKLLKAWRNVEGQVLEPNLLSDEVRSLLANSDDMDAQVEKRTEFMHLRTVRAKGSTKRGAESAFETVKRPPPKRLTRTSSVLRRKRAEPTIPRAGNTSAGSSRTRNSSNSPETGSKRKPDRTSKSPLRVPKAPRTSRQTSVSKSVDGPTGARRPLTRSKVAKKNATVTKPSPAKKRLTLPPFGHVLQQALTPTRKNKENKSTES